MDAEDPSSSTPFLQNERSSQRIKSRTNATSGGTRRNSYQQYRKKLEGLGSRRPGYLDGDSNPWTMSAPQKKTRTMPERVEKFYYSLGLLCSSHSYVIIVVTTLVVVISWYRGPPAAYIQQVIVRSAVYPWSNEMLLTDSFRGPLSQVFQVVENLKKFQVEKANVPFSQLCFSVGEVQSKVLKGKIAMLPEYGCLMVSPADFWQTKIDKFKDDPDVLSTILNYQSHQKGRSGLSEILFGMTVADTGFKRLPLKARPRVVSYAVTFVMQTFDPRYIDGLRYQLTHLYPSTQPVFLSSSTPESPVNNLSKNAENYRLENLNEELNMVHVYYPSQSSIFELIPLVITYLAMFIYVYFSMKKIDIITSKLGVAVSGVASVVASLCMSVGLCSHFGMSFEISATAIYPYLVIIIGLENILVLTRSVVSTAKNLDVKIRVAQGLSKEGWSITKNLLTEITILTIGFFTFLPAIQEFCILAVVGYILSDAFLQTFFFATVLSIDIHRQKFYTLDSDRQILPPPRTPIRHSDINGGQRATSSSQVKDQNGTLKRVQSQSGIAVIAPSHTPILVKIPKRLRLIYFWARTRFFQRTFTIFMIGWISIIIYQSGIVARFGHDRIEDVALPVHHEAPLHPRNLSQQMTLGSILHASNENYSKPLAFNQSESLTSENNSIGMQNNKLYRDLYSHNPYIWRRLTPNHWQVLFGVYNFTLTGKYITILPSICITIPVQPMTAIQQRHPLEVINAKRFHWPAFATAVEAIDSRDNYGLNAGPTVGKNIRRGIISEEDDPWIPSSPIELGLTMLLAIPSIMFIGYLVVSMYRCMCSRNYSEWRSRSWAKSNESEDQYTQVVFEAVPIFLDGHVQDVECIATDGAKIASVCLSGTLKVWHACNGENISSVDRQKYFDQLAQEKAGNALSDVESPSHSPFEDSCSDIGSNLIIAESNGNIFHNFPGTPIPSRILSPISTPAKLGPQSKVKHNQNSPIDLEPCFINFPERNEYATQSSPVASAFGEEVPAVWCIEQYENFVFLGTGNGRLEIWGANDGILKCIYEDCTQAGIVCMQIVGKKVILARLCGSLDFLEVETINNQVLNNSAYHRWDGDSFATEFSHSASFSVDSESHIRCVWLMTQKAHQQPITCLDCEGGRILTGSQDHTLKVFRLEDHLPLYTLHGHYGPITVQFIDKVCPMTSGSGSADGMLCVWDLLTGMCMYSIQAHNGSVLGITYSASYIITVGEDEINVWERFQGHLLNTIQLDHAYCSNLVMLTQNLLITSKLGSLIVWDVRSGRSTPVRVVRLGHRDNAVFVRQIISCADGILCDYGSQLRLVRFPSVVSKFD